MSGPEKSINMNERNFPLISVVVLNWNGNGFVTDCLKSLQAQTYHPLEMIVVDNGSTDGSDERIANEFPDVKLIKNGKNLGFGGGNNVGIKASQGRYIMILNNDTRLETRCIEEMKKAIERDDTYGACASRILLAGDSHLLDAAGICIYPDGLSIGRGRLEDPDRYRIEEEVFFASGCACLFRREMLEDIGLFDDDFFAYADEADLGWRAQLRGWKCVYNPNAVVYHFHSASYGTYSPLKAFLVERNRIWVALKYFPFPLLVTGPFYTLWRYLFQAYGALFGKGAAGRFTKENSKLKLIIVLLKVYISVLKHIPSILKKRKEFRDKKVISGKEVKKLFKRFGISAKTISLKE
jgi:GT2 family glycosyltransferase